MYLTGIHVSYYIINTFMGQYEVKILANKRISGKYFKLSFTSSLIAKQAKPGQFLEVKVNEGPEPFLRKPLSIHSVKGKTIEILYEIVGEGTEVLSKKKSGEPLDIIGPLGEGFDLRGTTDEGRRTKILVAGGIGVAPLVFLAEQLADHRPQTRDQRPLVLIGARTREDILCEKEFKGLGCDVKVATDDGSTGHKGFMTELLKDVLRGTRDDGRGTRDEGRRTIYACGPKPMMKEAARIAARHKIPCQVLLEEYMACGVGACLGCAVMTKDGYKMVCKDGPVFNAEEVIWE